MKKRSRKLGTLGGAMMQLTGWTWEDGPRERVKRSVVMVADDDGQCIGQIVVIGGVPIVISGREQPPVDPDLLRFVSVLP